MTLRLKLLLALAPLFLALLVISVVGGISLARLGKSSDKIFEDNYRSILAIQRMKESIENLDSSVLSIVAGRREAGEDLMDLHRRRFEEELKFQEGNLTEKGEREVTKTLRASWMAYLSEYDQFFAQTKTQVLTSRYFDRVLPAQGAVKDSANELLAMNEDAIVRKIEKTKHTAEWLVELLIAVSISGFLIALYVSTTIISRLLRPLSVLGQATRRIGEGDLSARARVVGKDEVAQLATDFNTMAGRLQKYRESSLGELLKVQRAAQATIDSLIDPVLILASDGHLTNVNRAAERLLKVSAQIGIEALDPAIRSLVDQIRRKVSTGKGAYLERGRDEPIRVTTPEGDRHFAPRATPIYAEEGDVTGITVILQDVTRLVRFEELRNNLVATVAHEFRTPLTSLGMAIHLLTEQNVGSLTEKQADLVYAAREECDRLQSIVNELLDLSRIQAGRMELSTKPVDAEILVRDALDAQETFANQRQVVLRNEALPGTGHVAVDVERIALVFANLLSNAIQHSPQRGEVKIRAFASEDSVRFEVSDTGPGISKEYHQAIFEKYFRVPGTPPGGAGFGLFIAKEIVQAHGGKIGVESSPGKGSTFWFSLTRGNSQDIVSVTDVPKPRQREQRKK